MATREASLLTTTEQAKSNPAERFGPYNGVGRWKPGESGNPGGRPKKDMASIIAQNVFEKDPEGIEAAFAKAMKKASPQLFAVLADRAFGKLKEQVEHSGEIGVSVVNRLLSARKRIEDSTQDE